MLFVCPSMSLLHKIWFSDFLIRKKKKKNINLTDNYSYRIAFVKNPWFTIVTLWIMIHSYRRLIQLFLYLCVCISNLKFNTIITFGTRIVEIKLKNLDMFHTEGAIKPFLGLESLGGMQRGFKCNNKSSWHQKTILSRVAGVLGTKSTEIKPEHRHDRRLIWFFNNENRLDQRSGTCGSGAECGSLTCNLWL